MGSRPYSKLLLSFSFYQMPSTVCKEVHCPSDAYRLVFLLHLRKQRLIPQMIRLVPALVLSFVEVIRAGQHLTCP